MNIIGKIHKFNTGRLYAKEGQPISWAIVKRDNDTLCVPFIDHARGIEQVIDVHVGNLDLIDDRWVLNAYDNYHYHYGSSECQFLRNALSAVQTS
jgi:hypothetical protein